MSDYQAFSHPRIFFLFFTTMTQKAKLSQWITKEKSFPSWRVRADASIVSVAHLCPTSLSYGVHYNVYFKGVKLVTSSLCRLASLQLRQPCREAPSPSPCGCQVLSLLLLVTYYYSLIIIITFFVFVLFRVKKDKRTASQTLNHGTITEDKYCKEQCYQDVTGTLHFCDFDFNLLIEMHHCLFCLFKSTIQKP